MVEVGRLPAGWRFSLRLILILMMMFTHKRGAVSSVTRLPQASFLHRMLTCTTRRAIAGPGILMVSDKLVSFWLLHRCRLGWFSLREVPQVGAHKKLICLLFAHFLR